MISQIALRWYQAAQQIWEDASEGREYARHIVAHEIGHLILHDNNAIAYSSEESAQLNFVEKMDSAEWQATQFADAFLVLDQTAQKLSDAERICVLCMVDENVVLRRLKDIATTFSGKRNPTGDMCSECSNFTLVRNGTCMKCDTCGSTTGCS